MSFVSLKSQRQKGLSLLEVLVAIAIVGIAAAIGIPTYNQMSQERNRKEAEMYLYQLLSAVKTQIRQHPDTLTQVSNINDDWIYNWQENLKNYASLPPKDSSVTTVPNNIWVSGVGNKQVRYFFDEDGSGILRLVAQFSDNSSIYVDINGKFGGSPNGNPNDQCNYAAQCNDGNACTTDSCAFDSNLNYHVCNYSNNDGATCNDNDGCTTGDSCSSGVCIGSGQPPNCDDGIFCTADSCVSPQGCVHVPANEGQACVQSNACITNPTCQGGSCAGTEITSCPFVECRENACDPVTGCNNLPPLPNGTPCNEDNNVCNGVYACQTGTGGVSCEMTQPDLGNCDDNNPCTIDSCDPINGCSHLNVANGTSCDADDNLCNGHPMCTNGVCGPNQGIVLCHPSQNFCQSEQCNPQTGQCEPITCPSGTVCNETLNQCTECAVNSDCDDGNSCTTDICDQSNGTCNTITIPDGNSCNNSLFCDGPDVCLNGTCQPQGNACPELDKPYCSETDDSCNECGDDSQCNDNNPCTHDKCDLSSLTCEFDPLDNGTSCDDGVFCNGVGICSGGNCVATLGCPPNKPNCVEATDSCFACTTNSQCNDNNPCTVDKCLNSLCVNTPKPGCLPPYDQLPQNQSIP